MSHTIAHLLVDILHAVGVRRIYGVAELPKSLHDDEGGHFGDFLCLFNIGGPRLDVNAEGRRRSM